MLDRIQRKLRSQRGASLSMALMLFLVCATVASIVLTASSAAAGRLAKLRETDKSYYNVTSAANLFWDVMSENPEGVAVTVARTYDGTDWKCTIDGKPINASQPLSSSNSTLFEIATCDLLFGTSGELTKDRTLVSADESIDTIASTIGDPDATFPLDVTFPGLEKLYDDITVAPTDNSYKAKFDTVNVAMSSLDNGEYQLSFSEDKPSCLCVIEMVASVSNSPVVVSGTTYTWTTTVYWQPQYMTMGDVA